MWFIAAISSYLINAGVYVADKFLLSKKIHSSVTYAFYVGIWSVFNIFILVFNPWVPNLKELALDLSAGVLFLFTLVFWYKALHQSEATRVVPIVGGLIPVFSFIFSHFFLGEILNGQQFIAFLILIAGGVLISVKRTKFYLFKKTLDRIRGIFGGLLGKIHAKYRPTRRLIINSMVSAFFFAAFYVLMKYIYLHQPFIGGFVWSRLGTFLGTLFILLVPEWRKLIVKHREHTGQPKNLAFFLAVRLAAAFAFILLNWSVSLGHVAIINALQGTQYIFLFLIILIMSAHFPKIIKEELGGGVMIQKLIGIVLVGIGLYALVV